jgi:uncharacterized membrane protein (Fun14 family)
MQVIRSGSPDRSNPEPKPRPAPASFEPLFARAHKRALGVAVGLTVGVAIFAVTILHVVFEVEGVEIGLLNQYFYGYRVTWSGAFIGLAWGFATGFIAGWMLGFVHNFTVGFWMFLVRTRNDLKRTTNFLDHI